MIIRHPEKPRIFMNVLPTKSTTLYRWMGVNAILLAGLIHLYLAPIEYRGAPEIAILFYAHFLGSLIATLGIALGGHLWGWTLGGFLAAGGIIDYLVSRTVGLPSFGVQTWGPPLAYFSIILETAFFIPFIGSYPRSLRRAN